MKKTIQISGLIFLVVIVLIQFVPVQRENPPSDSSQILIAPPPVQLILKRSCYDCHSHETVWPAYSQIAPISWLVAHDVAEGREHLNFSLWTDFSPEAQVYFKEQSLREIEEKKMPLPVYLIMHQDAKISQDDFDVLKAWVGEDEAEAVF